MPMLVDVSHKPILFYVKYGSSTGLVGRRMRTIFSPSKSVHTTVPSFQIAPLFQPNVDTLAIHLRTLGDSDNHEMHQSIPRVVAVVPTRVALSNTVYSQIWIYPQPSYATRFSGPEDGFTSNPSFGTSNAKHDAIISNTPAVNFSSFCLAYFRRKVHLPLPLLPLPLPLSLLHLSSFSALDRLWLQQRSQKHQEQNATLFLAHR